MSILLITKVKNEADIIEYFIRYHLNIVDHIVVIDNGSIDGTYEIVSAMIKEGLPLDLVNEGFSRFDAFRLANQYTEYYLKKYKNDYLIFADADELIVADNGDNPRSIVEGFDCDKVYYCRWKTYLYNDGDEYKPFSPNSYTEYREECKEHFEKVIIPAKMYFDNRIIVEAGNHSCHSEMFDCNPLPRKECQNIKFCHFPIRSLNQYKKQVVLNSISMKANPYVYNQTGSHWKDMFRIKDNTIDLRMLSMRYAYYDGSRSFREEVKYPNAINKYDSMIIWDLEKILFYHSEIQALKLKKCFLKDAPQMCEKTKVAVWGTGDYSTKMCGRIPQNCSIELYVDSDNNKEFSVFNGRIVVAPNKIRLFDFDIVLIASDKYEEEIRKQLKVVLPCWRDDRVFSIEEYAVKHYKRITAEKYGGLDD